MKKLFLVVVLVLGLFLVKTNVFAQITGDDAAKQHGVTFPITELGGCKDYNECRNFCGDPANYNACISYAKSKGFYKEVEAKPSQTVLANAKQALGCTSVDECRDFCSKESNYDKCHNFAQNNGLSGGYKEDPRKGEILSKAKETLGCTSYETCKSFCEDTANRDKCAQFAKTVNLNGGYEYKGPGGCTSYETCKSFCEDTTNVQICRSYAQNSGGTFSGPGGCSDEVSCRAYCEKNPTACPGFNPNATPNTTSTPSSNYQNYQTPIGSYTPYPTSGSYSGNTMTRDQQEAVCNSGGGTCVWNNDVCNCQGYHSSGSTSTPQSTPYSTPQSTQQSYSTDPATACGQTKGCTWTGTTCQCSSVQGASTVYNQGLLGRVLHILLGR